MCGWNPGSTNVLWKIYGTQLRELRPVRTRFTPTSKLDLQEFTFIHNLTMA